MMQSVLQHGDVAQDTHCGSDCLLVVPEWQSLTVVGMKQTACWWCQSGKVLPLLVGNRLPVGGARVAKSYRCW
jgi:hypothetical protein